METAVLARHPACAGCCQCLEPTPPIAPPAAPPPAWLRLDPDPWYTPADFLAVQVVHNASLRPEERVEACRDFMRAHGGAALQDALTAARDVQALPPELDQVLDTLKQQAGVGAR